MIRNGFSPLRTTHVTTCVGYHQGPPKMFGKPENRLAEQKSIKGVKTKINKAQALMIVS